MFSGDEITRFNDNPCTIYPRLSFKNGSAGRYVAGRSAYTRAETGAVYNESPFNWAGNIFSQSLSDLIKIKGTSGGTRRGRRSAGASEGGVRRTRRVTPPDPKSPTRPSQTGSAPALGRRLRHKSISPGRIVFVHSDGGPLPSPAYDPSPPPPPPPPHGRSCTAPSGCTSIFRRRDVSPRERARSELDGSGIRAVRPRRNISSLYEASRPVDGRDGPRRRVRAVPKPVRSSRVRTGNARTSRHSSKAVTINNFGGSPAFFTFKI